MGDASIESPRPPAGVAVRRVSLSHGSTRYLEAGEGPPVILLHGAGFLTDCNSWIGTMPGLAAAGLRLLAPDCLGWGESDQLEQSYSFAYLVDFVREFQDGLGLSRTSVVGHSMGGWIASLLAYESPQRVDRLVLVASGGLATRQLSTMTGFSAPTEDEIRAYYEQPGRATPESKPALTSEAIARARQPQTVRRFSGIMQHMSNPETRKRYNTARRLPLVTAPTLVLWGDEDTVNPIELGHRTAQLIPNAELSVVQGANHSLPQDHPEDFLSRASSFLTREVRR